MESNLIETAHSRFKPGVTIDNTNLYDLLSGGNTTKYTMTENDTIHKMPGNDMLLMSINGDRKNMFTIYKKGRFANVI